MDKRNFGRSWRDASAGILSMKSSDASVCRCPACRHRFDTINRPAKPLSQVKGRELSVCCYCGVFLIEDGHTLRVMTYTEFDLLDHEVRAEIVLKRAAILDHWRKQPLAAQPKPAYSSAASEP